MHREHGLEPEPRAAAARRLEHVVEHRGVERGRLLGREGRAQPRLHLAGRRLLREDDDDTPLTRGRAAMRARGARHAHARVRLASAART